LAEEFEDFGEKTEEPSSYRIEEFRKRGEVASSKEVTSILILLGNFLILGVGILYIFESMEEYVNWLYSLDLKNTLTMDLLGEIGKKTMVVALKCSAPIFIGSLLIGILSQIAQIGFLWAPEVLEPKLERLNPLDGFKKIFSTRGLVETAKSLAKLSIIIAVSFFYLKNKIPGFKGFLQMEIFEGFLFGKSIIMGLCFLILLGLSVVALADLAYQKFSYHKKIKQTREQAKREQKEHEGNPEIKQRIRTIQREAARRRMIQDVKKADVVVTNPTHYSVALKYDSKVMVSPKVVGKGADFLALRIRKAAKENDVPVVENIQLARNLYNTVKVGESIPRDLYKAVAEVLAFVYKLKRKHKEIVAR
jgi:flagellar biosynthetic protein FlhB